MKIKKRKLAVLESGYAVSMLNWMKKSWYLAGSESENGACLLIDRITGNACLVEGIGGGIMAFVPIPEEEGTFIAIRKFYPVFRSENAEIVMVRLQKTDESITGQVTVICRLPFVHRIALAGKAGCRKIIAATLCSKKAYTDDWSSPGGIYEVSLDTAEKKAPDLLLYDGLHKNHGMYTLQEDGRNVILVSAQEGIIRLEETEDESWSISKISDIPAGDLWLYDVDGDGNEELVVIEPFHGDTLGIYHLKEGAYSPVCHLPMNFGHVVWAGAILGDTYILGSSRGGDKNLVLHQVQATDGVIRFKTIVLSEGAGAAQALVIPETTRTCILTSDHAVGEITEIILEAEQEHV